MYLEYFTYSVGGGQLIPYKRAFKELGFKDDEVYMFGIQTLSPLDFDDKAIYNKTEYSRVVYFWIFYKLEATPFQTKFTEMLSDDDRLRYMAAKFVDNNGPIDRYGDKCKWFYIKDGRLIKVDFGAYANLDKWGELHLEEEK